MNRLDWVLTPSLPQIAFALRLCLAMTLALYLSMWLEMDRPYWATLEVAAMIQVMPGMAVARGFARAAGTVVAGAAGLVIMAVFGQYYGLSMAALVLWIAFCSFCANLLRNNLVFGFAIAGFIAGITVILSHQLDQSPFQVAVARIQECLLAAAIIMSVNLLFSPPTGVRTYFNQRIALLRSLGEAFQRLAGLKPRPESDTDDDQAPHPALQSLSAQALALDYSRKYARFESPQFANLNRLARRLDYDLLSFISALSSLHIYLSRRYEKVDTRPLDMLLEPARVLAETPQDSEAIRRAFDQAHRHIRALAGQPAEHGKRRRLPDWVVLSRALSLAGRGRAVMVTHGLLLDERRHPTQRLSPRSEFTYPIYVRHAFRNSMRTLTAATLAGLIWVNFHDQLPTVIMVILTSGLTTIFASTPYPLALAGGFARGLALAAVMAFVIDFFILPEIHSFAILMVALMPPIFIAGLAMATPRFNVALPGRISMIMFSLLVHIQNGAIQDFSTYIHILIGIVTAVSLTGLSFHLIFPVSSRQRLREQMTGVLDEVSKATRGSREHFETRMYDRLNTLALSDIEFPYRFSARRAVQASLNMGLELRSLIVVARRLSLPPQTMQYLLDEAEQLRRTFKRKPGHVSLSRMAASSRAFHDIASQVLAYTDTLEGHAEHRLGVRAAICAELTASALEDYLAAFEDGAGEPADVAT